MAKIKFTSALNRFFPELEEMQVRGQSVLEVLLEVNRKHPGLNNYLLEEDGTLRKHVNIFLQNEMINDRSHLSDKVGDNDEILVFQALSGG